MVKSRRKSTKSKKSSKDCLISARQQRFLKWGLLVFSLVFVAFAANFVLSSFASNGQSVVPHTYSPNSSINYKIAPNTKQLISFVANYTGTTRSGVLMQVAYHEKSSSDIHWTTLASSSNLPAFASNSTEKLSRGPNSITMMVNPDYNKNSAGYTPNNLMDPNGLNCGMGYGSANPPTSCYVTWKNNRQSGTAAFEATNVYFPTISLPIGNYEWATRGYNISTKTYTDWSKKASFNIQDSTQAAKNSIIPPFVAPIVAPIVNPIKNLITPPKKQHITIVVLGNQWPDYKSKYKQYGPYDFTMVVNDSNKNHADYQYYIDVKSSVPNAKNNGWDSSAVRAAVMKEKAAQHDRDVLYQLFDKGGRLANKDNVRIAIVCSRGHHRSATLAWYLKDHLLNSKGLKGKWTVNPTILPYYHSTY